MWDVIFNLPIINLLPAPLQSLLVLILFVLVIILTRMLFLHPLYSRIAGVIVAVIAFIVGLNIPKEFTDFPIVGAIYLSVIYTFSSLFAMGSEVFDTYWDGTYRLHISRDIIDLKKNISGGFIANFLGSTIVGFFLSYLALSSMPFLLWLIPIILAIANIVLIVQVIRN